MPDETIPPTVVRSPSTPTEVSSGAPTVPGPRGRKVKDYGDPVRNAQAEERRAKWRANRAKKAERKEKLEARRSARLAQEKDRADKQASPEVNPIGAPTPPEPPPPIDPTPEERRARLARRMGQAGPDFAALIGSTAVPILVSIAEAFGLVIRNAPPVMCPVHTADGSTRKVELSVEDAFARCVGELMAAVVPDNINAHPVAAPLFGMGICGVAIYRATALEIARKRAEKNGASVPAPPPWSDPVPPAQPANEPPVMSR